MLTEKCWRWKCPQIRCRLTRRMKVWIGHPVSPIRPTLWPHPSLSGQQTLQHYFPLNWFRRLSTTLNTTTFRGAASSPVTQLPHRRTHIWGPLAPPQNGKLTTRLIHGVNFGQKFSIIYPPAPLPSFPVLQLLTKVALFVLSMIQIGRFLVDLCYES